MGVHQKNMHNLINSYAQKQIDSSALILFRIGFGVIMCYSLIRFWLKGWIELLYIKPDFHFSYYGFEWIKPMENYTYLLFIICFISSLFVALGYKYRLSIVVFFLSFTYIELMDKTTYLNHYYFISVLSFLMIFLPANANFSLDNYHSKRAFEKIPQWNVDAIKLMITIVYLYAGIAKINTDWLLEAMPLKIWLTSKYDIPIIGTTIMQENWAHYLMSWGSMFYDISIPFLLMYSRTRLAAFLLVVFFHLFTLVLFPIGMFPHIMIFSSLIFFNSNFHKKILKKIKNIFLKIRLIPNNHSIIQIERLQLKNQKIILSFLFLFLSIQLLLPFRYKLYPGELFWHEQGYRFSWRVMLIEKIGYTTFKIKDKKSGSAFMINNKDYLTPFQEKQMSFQPDFILEYAHYLGDKFSNNTNDIEVYTESFVALNGRPSQRFIDPKVNLYKEIESFKNKNWVLPLNDEIKGF